MGEIAYYQRNREVVLNRVKYHYENNKEVLRATEKISTENYLKKRRILKENMEEIDKQICLKKRNKD